MSFIHIRSHTGESLASTLLDFLKEHDVDIMNCRGQSYDNAANMSGKFRGMQAMIKKVNPFALYVPCAAHSLNLIGQAAVDSCKGVVYFFEFVQKLYNFFSKATHRWDMLRDVMTSHKLVMPKDLSDTRWSARFDAEKALYQGYSHILDVLNTISDSETEPGDVQCTANGLGRQMEQLEISFFTVSWYEILERFNSTSKLLQKEDIDLNTCVGLYQSLFGFVQNLRDEFDKYETDAIALCGNDAYIFEYARNRKRNVRLKDINDKSAPEVELSGREKFRTQDFLTIVDKLAVELKHRQEAYSSVTVCFGFLNDLRDLPDSKISSCADNLLKVYSNDLEVTLSNELVQFKYLINSDKAFEHSENKAIVMEMFEFIKKT